VRFFYFILFVAPAVNYGLFEWHLNRGSNYLLPMGDSESRVKRLRTAAALLTEAPPQALTVGDLVCWKSGMRNRNDSESEGVVLRRLDEPLVPNVRDAGNTAFNEQLSLYVGFLDKEKNWVAYWVDPRRLSRCDVATEETIGLRRLRKRAAAYRGDASPLRPGDIVRYKKHFANKTMPAKGELAIVTRVLPTPICENNSKKTATSPFFREPLDVCLMLLTSPDQTPIVIEFWYARAFFDALMTIV
ncbi:Hypothetical protein UVM_LOCUS341, partial [uncultured virus]